MRLEALFNSQSGGAPPICPWEPPKSGAELEGRGSYGSVASALKRYADYAVDNSRRGRTVLTVLLCLTVVLRNSDAVFA